MDLPSTIEEESYITRGFGPISIPFKYSIRYTLHSFVDFCYWQGYIVTYHSEYNIKVWTTNGELVARYFVKNAVSMNIHTGKMVVWDDMLVTTIYDSSDTVRLWKLEKVNNEITLVMKKSMRAGDFAIRHILVWNNKLYAFSSYCRIAVVDMNGKTLYTREFDKIMRVKQIIVWQDSIWIGLDDCRIIEFTKGHSINCTLQGHQSSVVAMCVWDSRLVSSEDKGTIIVWNSNKEIEFKLTTEDCCTTHMVAWQERLVCSASSDNNDHYLFLWNLDGSLFQKITACPTTQLMTVGNYLWQGWSDGCICVWSFLREWKIERLLWIAWKKNDPKECVIASLPKELVIAVISLLYL